MLIQETLLLLVLDWEFCTNVCSKARLSRRVTDLSNFMGIENHQHLLFLSAQLS